MRLTLNSAAGLRSRAFAALLVAVAITFAGGLPPRAVGQEDDAARPSLGDLMALIQLRHFKLWYAQRVGNWQLADYELGQFEQTMRRIGKLYPMARSIAQGELIREKTDPPMVELRQALAERNSERFEEAYTRLTNACNQCHQATGVGFIVMQTPTGSPLSNQEFDPSR